MEKRRKEIGRPSVTLENCAAIRNLFEPGSLTSTIVWRNRKCWTRPAIPTKCIRELEPGDVVYHMGERLVVAVFEVYHRSNVLA